MAALILKSFFIPPKYQFNNCNGNSKVFPYNYGRSTTLSSSKNLNITHHHKKHLRNHTHIHASYSKELVAHDNQQGLGIVHFLKGKHFLITGATGFLGKVLIEKILRVAPDVGKIYLLINSENTDAALKRLKNEIMNLELFKTIRETHGKSYEAFMLSKLVPVSGNICDSNVGLQGDLANTIAQQVDIIVNSAATTNFTERYDIALNLNTRGPSHLIEFAKSCEKLKLFMHVSTAYVNGERQGKVLEKPFRMGDSIAREKTSEAPILDVEGEFELALQYSKQAFSSNFSMTQKLKGLGLERAKMFGWQNTYVFTKAMGEMMFDSVRGDLPVVIIRPSIIESTIKDPFPGWIEGYRMMDPVVTNYGTGKLLGFVADPDVPIDIIPVDMVVNTMLAAMTRHATTDKNSRPDIDIYQVGSSVANPINYRYMLGVLYDYFSLCPMVDSRGKPIEVLPFQSFSSTEELYDHILRDVIQRNGSSNPNDPQIKRTYKKSVMLAQKLTDIYEPYTFYGGRFDNNNTERLMEHISDAEKKMFDFDVKDIDWRHYITNVHIPGLRRHVLQS